MTEPFIIFGLPRSRTAWLSRFLSYGEWHCGHDELRHMRSLEDVRSWFAQPCTGTVETAAAPWWRLIERYAPRARVVTIRRPVDDVMSSLMRLGLPFDMNVVAASLGRLDRKLDQIEARLPDVLSVPFADLASEEVCALIFEHLLPYRHDPTWWAAAAAVNVQIDMRAALRHLLAYAPQIDKLARMAKQETLSGFAARRPVAPDGVTLQVEPFETWLRDGSHLFRQHLVEVGEAPDAYLGKNLAVMRAIDAAGAMQIMTARCNGRMFGYLMTVLSPSLESESVTSATNATFYASREFPGLGMKLQRAAVEALRARGVGELFLRAGVRGSGPKMGALYRRMGAEDFGQLFKLEMKAA